MAQRTKWEWVDNYTAFGERDDGFTKISKRGSGWDAEVGTGRGGWAHVGWSRTERGAMAMASTHLTLHGWK